MQENFEEVLDYPNPEYQKRFAKLIGLEQTKESLIKESRLLLSPKLLTDWSEKFHNTSIAAIDNFMRRHPFFIFAGDVGTGKTELAKTFGNAIAQSENISVTLYSLSLNARGTGAVGEMTRLIGNAFDYVKSKSQPKRAGVAPTAASILLIDEADALVQSREMSQMHHEDRAGVNAVIRGIDSLATGGYSAIVVMCTNRLSAIDPAIRRRAATVFDFIRPDAELRMQLLKIGLQGIELNNKQIEALVGATGPIGDREYGFTGSDIVCRLVPAIVLDAFDDKPITFNLISKVIKKIKPTPPFQVDTL